MVTVVGELPKASKEAYLCGTVIGMEEPLFRHKIQRTLSITESLKCHKRKGESLEGRVRHNVW